jgi:3-oxoacyl-[acyl-carrier-protein] synthase III
VRGISIVGTGHYVPGKPITNHALARVMETNDAWIQKRTGIRQRHFAEAGQGVSDLAVKAAERALEQARLTAKDVDYIVFATMTPDYVFPGSGGLLGANLGIEGVPALDIRQQCCAMPFALQVSNGLVATGAARTILIVGAEIHAGFMPWSSWDLLYQEESTERAPPEEYEKATRHRGVAVLFGDGAGAMVVREAEQGESGLLGVEIRTDGSLARQIYIPGGGFRNRPFISHEVVEKEQYIPAMGGRELFKTAVTRLPEIIRSVCAKHDISVDDIDWFVAHQANDRINQAVVEAIGISPDKVPSNIGEFGNTSAATIPILLDQMVRDGRVKKGQLLCLFALGAGVHWGAALMRF